MSKKNPTNQEQAQTSIFTSENLNFRKAAIDKRFQFFLLCRKKLLQYFKDIEHQGMHKCHA